MRILVAGVGNVFLGDDGFGVAAVSRLQTRPMPTNVDIADFGIRGIDLAYALEEYEAAIILDTVSRGGTPGTLYLLDPSAVEGSAMLEMHSMTPDRVLQWHGNREASKMLRIVGCEPASFGEDGLGQLGLSEPVQAALDEAAAMVGDVIADWLRQPCTK